MYVCYTSRALDDFQLFGTSHKLFADGFSCGCAMRIIFLRELDSFDARHFGSQAAGVTLSRELVGPY